MGLCIIITGNPVDGFGYFGPFKTCEHAFRHAEELRLQEWWIAPLEAPNEAAA
jgi:hypothetical protein